jgi:hypothetical protein
MNTMLAAAFHGGLGGAGDPSPSSSTHSKPVYVSGHVSKDWTSFYNDWVHPVVNFGTPTLIVLAVLLTLSVTLTPALVYSRTRGLKSAHWSRTGPLRTTYWFGVVCLLFSAAEFAIVYPVSRHVRPVAWSAAVAIGLTAGAAAVISILFGLVGRGWKIARSVILILLTGASLLAGALFNLALSGARPLHWSWHLDGQFSSLIYAGLLAIAGIVIAGRVRGISIGMLIQGHDKTGSDDAGLGAFVRARLYAMGSAGPSGILITQQTDVDTLPSGALNLIPEGNLAKLATLFVSLFTPATPWRVDVVEQSDGSVIVSIRRNGKVVDTTAIRASALGLPTQSRPESGKPAPDWTAELRTAAAAFILLVLSKRYQHLEPGLSGATRWRSVALQVIASDPVSKLSDEQRRALLERAIADDSHNNAAQLALLNSRYRTATGAADHLKFARKFKKLLDQVHGGGRTDGIGEQTSPLELRLRFNLLVACGNYVTSLKSDDDASQADCALTAAKEQADSLLEYWDKDEPKKKRPELRRSMYGAVYFAREAIEAEMRRRQVSTGSADATRSKLPDDVDLTFLALYEHTCALTRQPSRGSSKADDYTEALDNLEIAVNQPSLRTWARTDPSLDDLQDVNAIAPTLGSSTANLRDPAYGFVTRFKGLVGDPVTSDFLALPPIAPHRDALELRGVHNAEQLRGVGVNDLVSDLSITLGEARRWRELARLHQWLASATTALAQAQNPGGSQLASAQAQNVGGSDTRATQLVFLLLLQNLDTIELTRKALSGASFKASLLSQARPWAVVAPGTAELSAWESHDES